MYKISELIGKEAITLSDALKQGTVSNVYFDTALSRARYFTLLSDEDEEPRYTDFKNLTAFGSDAVVINSGENVLLLGDCPGVLKTAQSPINLPAFNQDGKSLGTVRDIEMEGAEVLRFITDLTTVEAGTLISRSDEVLVFNDTGKELKVKRKAEPKPKVPPAKAETAPQTITAHTAATGSVLIEKVGEKIEKNGEVQTPPRIPNESTAVHHSPYTETTAAQSRYSFLLGKRLQKSLYGELGSLIAREDDLITEAIILSAKKNGKLVALALHSL